MFLPLELAVPRSSSSRALFKEAQVNELGQNERLLSNAFVPEERWSFNPLPIPAPSTAGPVLPVPHPWGFSLLLGPPPGVRSAASPAAKKPL